MWNDFLSENEFTEEFWPQYTHWFRSATVMRCFAKPMDQFSNITECQLYNLHRLKIGHIFLYKTKKFVHYINGLSA